MRAASLLHLLQLASPSLPIGAYSYSQGMESALENGLVTDAASARRWIVTTLHEVVARFEMPVLWRLLDAFERRDADAVALWSERFLAARDTAEFRAETVQMGFSLVRLTGELFGAADDAARQEIPGTAAGSLSSSTPAPTRPPGHVDAVAPARAGTAAGDGPDSELREMLATLARQPEVTLPTAYAFAAVALDIPAEDALLAMLFAWAENQVLVCVKSVPLGQVAGQRLLLSLRPELELAAVTARALEDDELSSWSPGLSLLSMQHETQYSRLYRS
jgi:urease accessory protein